MYAFQLHYMTLRKEMINMLLCCKKYVFFVIKIWKKQLINNDCDIMRWWQNQIVWYFILHSFGTALSADTDIFKLQGVLMNDPDAKWAFSIIILAHLAMQIEHTIYILNTTKYRFNKWKKHWYASHRFINLSHTFY